MVFAVQQLDVVQLDSAGSLSGELAPPKHLTNPLSLLPWNRSPVNHQYRLVALDPEGQRVRQRFAGKRLGRDDTELEAWPEERLLMLYAVPVFGHRSPSV